MLALAGAGALAYGTHPALAQQRGGLEWILIGRRLAFAIDHTIKPRELEIVSMPADAMLIYNSRIGQFINALTGLTIRGERPDGFHGAIETQKTSWRQWRLKYPEARVMATALSS